MRQLLVQVPQGCGKTVLDIALACDGTNLAQFEAAGVDRALDLVFVHVSNGKVEELLNKLQDLPDLSFTLLPTGVMALHPPANATPDQVTNVEERSPIEIFLAGLQSTGSWKGFLSYAAIAGVVVWIGLYTNTSYLLVAAMLLAPFAGPAMNAALATARGDRQLLWRSIVRYFAALSRHDRHNCPAQLGSPAADSNKFDDRQQPNFYGFCSDSPRSGSSRSADLDSV